jgi:hypothetical protein
MVERLAFKHAHGGASAMRARWAAQGRLLSYALGKEAPAKNIFSFARPFVAKV